MENHNFTCYQSENREIIDISYKDPVSASISNLFPHNFLLSNGIKCLSMESFIQSLRVPNKIIQEKICSNYSGYVAYKMRLSLPDWRESGKVNFFGEKIIRNSERYDEIITSAYDSLFQNQVFRFCLESFKDKIIIHSIGSEDKSQSLLTKDEYIYQLERLRKKL